MKSSRPVQHSLPHIADFSLGEDVEFVIGLTAAALAGNEVVKIAQSHQNRGSHLVKAGLSTALAVGSLNMMMLEHRDHHENHNGHNRQRPQKQHSRSMFEGNEHDSHGHSDHHKQDQYSRDVRRHSDHKHIHHHDEGESCPHHHHRHSLDLTEVPGSLPGVNTSRHHGDWPDGEKMPTSAQSSESGYFVHYIRPSNISASTPNWLETQNIGHCEGSFTRSHAVGHHVHFSNDPN